MSPTQGEISQKVKCDEDLEEASQEDHLRLVTGGSGGRETPPSWETGGPGGVSPRNPNKFEQFKALFHSF